MIGVHRQMRQDVTSYRIRLTGETAATPPKALTAIVLDHVIRGRGRISDLVHRVVERFATRYGPASALLWPVALTDDATGTEVKGTLTR